MRQCSYLLIALNHDFLKDLVFHYIDEYTDKNLDIGHVDVILIYGKSKKDIKLTFQAEKDRLSKVNKRSQEQENIFVNISILLDLLEDENFYKDIPQSAKDWSERNNRNVNSENSIFLNVSVD